MHLEALQELALRISGERDVGAVLQCIVKGLAQQPGIALARVWVVKPGDICQSCRLRPSCPDQTACLHLSRVLDASITGESWSRTDGNFRRMPIGRLKVGSIASERAGVLIADPQFRAVGATRVGAARKDREFRRTATDFSRRNAGGPGGVPTRHH